MIRATMALPLALALAGQFRVSVDVVRFEALVLQNGRPVSLLAPGAFVVTDNGVRQTVTVRPLARQPIDVVVALDISDSVSGQRLERLRAGALALVDQLTPEDRATLVTFNHALTLGPRDAAPASLITFLRRLEADGSTGLVDAATSGLVWGWGRERPTLLLVFSDGRDTASWTRTEQALALARTSDAVVDAIVAGELLPTSTARIRLNNLMDQPTPDERFLSELTAVTGGRVRNGEAGAGLAGAFAAALEQFRARYEITYSPPNNEPGWHAIDLKVPSRRGVSVHARRGYQR